MTRGGKTYYYQTNYRGDVVALTDSAGAVVATYEYDAYGNLLKETGNVENPYRYAGYRYDGETGLYYLQSRYYNPETGRFLTRDTFEGFENEPLSLNKYSYVHNNPVVYVDPDGQSRKKKKSRKQMIRCLAKAMRYAFQYWIASYIGWRAAGSVIDKFFILGGAALQMRATYRVEYKHGTRQLRRSIGRVFKYSTIKQARRIALRAALRAGIKVIPFGFITDAWSLGTGAYLGYRRYC